MFKMKILPIMRRALDCLFHEGRVFRMKPFENKFHGRSGRSAVLEDSRDFLRPVDFSAGHLPTETARVAHRLCLGQISLAAAQFSAPFRYLHLEFVASLAEFFLRAAALMDEARALECCRGVIRSHRKQQLVNLGGKVGAITRRSYQTALGIYTDGNDNTAAWLHAANVGNDFLTRKLPEDGKVMLQPFGKSYPSIPPRHVDGSTAVGIAQANEGEIEVQRSDQHIGKPGSDGRRFSPNPRRRNGGKCHDIPECGS